MSFSVNQLINSHLKTRISSKRDMILLNLQRKSTRTKQLTDETQALREWPIYPKGRLCWGSRTRL